MYVVMVYMCVGGGVCGGVKVITCVRVCRCVCSWWWVWC